MLGERVAKLEVWKERGFRAYPYSFARTHTVDELRGCETDLEDQEVAFAGRIMSSRGHGKTMFANVQDATGHLQVYARHDDLGEKPYADWRLVEVGDWIGVRGVLFRTRTDELTLKVRSFELLAKSLRPLPDKWHGLSDKEVRYRQRYVDLLVNPEVRQVFVQRSGILAAVRNHLLQRGFLEVETPVLQPLYGGASARPFVTQHHALGMELYLRIAPELYLKRLLVGGFEGVFEMARNFRNEGMDRTHNPEFTMLELYVAYWDYEDMLRLTEELVRDVAQQTGSLQVEFGDHSIDFTKGFEQVSFHEALERSAGRSLRGLDARELTEVARQHEIDLDPDAQIPGILDTLFSAWVEPKLVQPTFVLDYPKELSPLAKDHRDTAGLVERFELFAGGFELANAFSELNDPVEQRQRFEAQVALRAGGDLEAQPLDEDYLRALEYGMPPAGGLGLGIDRLVMLLTGCTSIRDVLLFPALRPETPESRPEPESVPDDPS